MRLQENFTTMITGAGKGYGLDIAVDMAILGGKIAVVDSSPVPLDQVIHEFGEVKGEYKSIISDMAKKRTVQGTLEEIRQDWDIINAVILTGFINPGDPLLTLDEWAWQRILDVNLSGVFYTLQSYARICQEQPGGGSAVILLSREGNSGYKISMEALTRLIYESSREFSTQHLRVNGICPDGMSRIELFTLVHRYMATPEYSGMLSTKSSDIKLAKYFQR